MIGIAKLLLLTTCWLFALIIFQLNKFNNFLQALTLCQNTLTQNTIILQGDRTSFGVTELVGNATCYHIHRQWWQITTLKSDLTHTHLGNTSGLG